MIMNRRIKPEIGFLTTKLKILKIRVHHTRLVTIILIAAVIFIAEHFYNKRYTILYWKPITRNVSCHYSKEGDVLQSAESPNFAPAENSIFFHETSCRGGLTSRQACAVESAARAHPNRQIHVLFSSPITGYVFQSSVLGKLQELQNINLARVHIEEYCRGVYSYDMLDTLASSEFAVSHTSDLLRIVTLKKWGGVYMDTDFVVMRTLDQLPANWVAKQADYEVAFGVLALGKDETGRNISSKLLHKMVSTYDPDDRIGNGPGVITAVVGEICPETIAPAGGHCKDLYVYGRDLFYPLYYRWAQQYFGPGVLDFESTGPYMHHMWNGLTWNLKVQQYSPYASLAKKFCPSVYELYGDEFGV